MGDLIRTPYSEVTATLEILDKLGVTPHDLEVFRKASSWSRTVVARVLRTDPFLWSMLCVEQDAERAGFREGDFQKLAADPDLLARVLHDIRENEPPDPIFKVEVDYNLTLEQMIESGRYDWVNGDITPEHFPIQGEGRVERELVLVHLDRVASTDEVLAEFDRRGLRPAKIEEHLVFGAKFTEEQRKFPVVGLASSFVGGHGNRYFAYLYRRGAKRDLGLGGGLGGWGEGCRFLAARK